ncbi:MAG: Asp23/Gls24 family envelope stress response protein [Christensenellales bacterium]
MAEETMQEVQIKNEKSGKITFNNDVIATIAGLSTVEVDGVAGMSGGFTSGVAELLGRKNMTKGVKVEVGTEECAVDLNIIVRYGSKIPEVCENIYQEVKKGIETMTGLRVVEVNIHVQGVQIEKKAESPAEPVSEPTPRVR